MRAFHYSWLSFFIAFFGWFSIPPLMPTIKKQLNLTEDQVSNSNIVSLASTIIGRLIVGPLCDRYGARTVQAVLLVIGAIPVASAALVVDYSGLMFVRFFIGLVGCSFVATAYWTSTMFSHEVVGSANAISCGWGNLGAGVTYLVTPLIFDLITVNDSISYSYGWRMALLVPAILMVIIGICTYKFSDDCPQGNYVDLKRNHVMADRATSELYYGFVAVARQPVSWILAFQYACCFGVELQVHNVLSLYYYEDFKITGCDAATDANACRLLTQTKASAISSCFGLMCIFARAVGGYVSDISNRHYDMKGRISMQLLCLAFQAVFLYLYSQIRVLTWSIPCLVVFGFFAQASTGTTYGIVPYVCPEYTGVTSGIVGAGGNMGGLAWGFLFKGTGGCSPDGPRERESDVSCDVTISPGLSGYCLLRNDATGEEVQAMRVNCSSLHKDASFTCREAEDFARVAPQISALIEAKQGSETQSPLQVVTMEANSGVVMVMYPRLIDSVYATVRLLRSYNCSLPVELWYLESEMGASPLDDSRVLQILVKEYSPISLRGIADVTIGGFNSKVFALAHSALDQVLFLDADNAPVKDPTYLFSDPKFVETGALFWPDFWHPNHTLFNVKAESLVWELVNTPFVDMLEQESGQLLIDRRRSAVAMEVVQFLALRKPDHLNLLKLLYGDKDIFRVAWLKTKTPFHFINTPAGAAGMKRANQFCGMTMVQHDTKVKLPSGRTCSRSYSPAI
ncbi:hypothetical protein BBI17_008840 [Phytophthora kernoviae]|uniref:Major facilitator superfamily (MFS) profile domain-containing protein n=2 Tax=Phytophthora kernoviae TaxID=325452 RepID=A0A421FEL6_9STRA|nr:hypothetical protein G195_010785 [Phytophthora kernoviae 00238/432]KAG2507251.1 hypothetical protein JM16_009058 [Phytophthora kernoviae]RLN43589.1 hypothetical protein BBI17_008840 [Phytophthora kernoviae]